MTCTLFGFEQNLAASAAGSDGVGAEVSIGASCCDADATNCEVGILRIGIEHGCAFCAEPRWIGCVFLVAAADDGAVF